MALLIGLALGERGELGAARTIYAAGIPIILGVFAWRSHARVGLAVFSFAMFAGLGIGWLSWNRAYEDCTSNADTVRASLDGYFLTHHRYPDHLGELPAKPPCRCLTRPTILHYSHDNWGYKLWYGSYTNAEELVGVAPR